MDIKSNSVPELPRPISQNSDPNSRPFELNNNINNEPSVESNNSLPELEPLQNQVASIAVSGVAPANMQVDDNSSVTTSSDDNAQAKSDEDVIKKLWVDKAKNIIKETSGDPRRRSNKLANFKADYVGARFNKTLKVTKEES